MTRPTLDVRSLQVSGDTWEQLKTKILATDERRMEIALKVASGDRLGSGLYANSALDAYPASGATKAKFRRGDKSAGSESNHSDPASINNKGNKYGGNNCRGIGKTATARTSRLQALRGAPPAPGRPPPRRGATRATTPCAWPWTHCGAPLGPTGEARPTGTASAAPPRGRRSAGLGCWAGHWAPLTVSTTGKGLQVASRASSWRWARGTREARDLAVPLPLPLPLLLLPMVRARARARTRAKRGRLTPPRTWPQPCTVRMKVLRTPGCPTRRGAARKGSTGSKVVFEPSQLVFL